jgi:hypothetical protein
MNVIRQILSKIVDSTEEVVLIESLGKYENLNFHINLLNEEAFITKIVTKPRPNYDTASSIPDAVKMTWKGYDLYDRLRGEHAIYLKSQGL